MKQWKKRTLGALLAGCLVLLLSLTLTIPAFAAGEPAGGTIQAETAAQMNENTTSSKAYAAAIAIGIAAAGGAIAMGIAVAKASESISRQPEAEGKVRTTLMLGLVFIETAIIYALLVVILIIFVL